MRNSSHKLHIEKHQDGYNSAYEMWMQDLFPSFPALSIRRPFRSQWIFFQKTPGPLLLEAKQAKWATSCQKPLWPQVSAPLLLPSVFDNFWNVTAFQNIGFFVVLWRAGCWKQTVQQKKIVCTFTFSIYICIKYMYTYAYIYIYTFHLQYTTFI